MKFFYLFLLTSLLLHCKSSDDSIVCTLEFVYGINVIVKDASTQNSITENINVSITDGNYQETLLLVPNSDTFVGAGERAGNYTITITAVNYHDFTSDVITLTSNECHVIPKALTFNLEPL